MLFWTIINQHFWSILYFEQFTNFITNDIVCCALHREKTYRINRVIGIHKKTLQTNIVGLFQAKMPPQGQQSESWVLNETDLNKDADTPIVPPSAEKRKLQIVWRNVILFALLHIGGLYGAYLFFTQAMWSTRLFGKKSCRNVQSGCQERSMKFHESKTSGSWEFMDI